jgi:Peptidase M16 inactive domain
VLCVLCNAVPQDFHAQLYHPSNARFWFYGDDDPEERLRILAAYLDEFEAREVDSAVRPQPLFRVGARGEAVAEERGTLSCLVHVASSSTSGEWCAAAAGTGGVMVFVVKCLRAWPAEEGVDRVACLVRCMIRHLFGCVVDVGVCIGKQEPRRVRDVYAAGEDEAEPKAFVSINWVMSEEPLDLETQLAVEFLDYLLVGTAVSGD